MNFALGFLAAALLGLLLVPLVHRRAVRLTLDRVEAAPTPVSAVEFHTDRDQLRATLAMSARRLEISVATMKAMTMARLAELGQKTDSIAQLEKELGDKAAVISALEVRDRAFREQLNLMEDEFKTKSGALQAAERLLGDKEAELVQLIAELGEQTIVADSQRLEVAALRTQVEAIKESVARYENALTAMTHRLARGRDEADAARTNLANPRATRSLGLARLPRRDASRSVPPSRTSRIDPVERA